MIKKKNGFLLFICSLFPGAGEMYLGFMKEGVSIMGLTFVLLVITALLGIDQFIFFLPIIWFYSFFNAHNKAGLSDEEFYSLEDDYLFHMDRLIPEGKMSGKQESIFGWILILLGILIIWRPAVSSMLSAIALVSQELADLIGRALYQLPKYVAAFVLIVCGIRLVTNKKKELEKEEIQ